MENIMENRNKRAVLLKKKISDIPKELMLPVSKTKGMRDFVRDVCGYYSSWEEFYSAILLDSELCKGGLLKGASEVWIALDTYPNFLKDAYIDIYDIYLCTDGRLRYRRTKEQERLVHKLAEERSNDFWTELHESMNENGYDFIESDCCWRHRESGEEVCY